REGHVTPSKPSVLKVQPLSTPSPYFRHFDVLFVSPVVNITDYCFRLLWSPSILTHHLTELLTHLVTSSSYLYFLTCFITLF
ncbi:hypothetical protein AMATHDRAFT_55948, partial [Amanita thiersii Skay4041]